MFHAVNRADHTQGFWNRPRQPGMTEMQYQVNNWYHFVWLSGDHIVEQHVHGIDACNWITRGAPVQATGVGGRRSGPSPASAKFSITTASSTPVPMARTDSASAGSNPAAGRASATMPTGQRVLLASTAETRSWSSSRVRSRSDSSQARDGHQTEWDDLLAAVGRQSTLQRARPGR